VVVVDLPVARSSAEDLYRGIQDLETDHAHRLVFLASDLHDTGTRKLLARAGRPFLTKPADGRELYELVVRVAREPDGG
jgi:hypothetical protein